MAHRALTILIYLAERHRLRNCVNTLFTHPIILVAQNRKNAMINFANVAILANQK